MLPRTAYVDPAVFAWEQRHFFGGGWMCVGRSDQIAGPGDQRAESVGEGSVLLVRDDDGVLHAFANTCRHRGHELLPCGAAAQQKVIICPYHSWTYGLDGSLRAAAGFKNQPGFAAEQWGLTELPVTEWHGLIFVDGSGSAAPARRLRWARWTTIVAPYEIGAAGRGRAARLRAAANWKILTENYHECYHCPTIHPELCQVSPPKSGENYPARGPGSAAGWTCATAWPPCRWTAPATGPRCAGWTRRGCGRSSM